MADNKNAKPADAGTPAAPAEAPRKKFPVKVIAVALAVVALEAGTVVGTMSIAGGPKRAGAADLPQQPKAEVVERDAEIRIVDKNTRMPNTQSGRLYLYDIEIFAKVGEKNKDKVAALLKEREAEIQDRIRTIVASSDTKSLSEPGLETLRRQITYQLEQDLGKDLIKEILIPKCTPIKLDF